MPISRWISYNMNYLRGIIMSQKLITVTFHAWLKLRLWMSKLCRWDCSIGIQRTFAALYNFILLGAKRVEQKLPNDQVILKINIKLTACNDTYYLFISISTSYLKSPLIISSRSTIKSSQEITFFKYVQQDRCTDAARISNSSTVEVKIRICETDIDQNMKQ